MTIRGALTVGKWKEYQVDVGRVAADDGFDLIDRKVAFGIGLRH
jgi:hypothetical protein